MRLPGPNALQFMRGVHKEGFLHHVGQLWRAHGDVFAARAGRRTLIFAMHPDAVERVNISGRDKYNKLKTYDPVRRYLTGQGLLTSTGSLWRRQRKLLSPFFTPKGIQSYAELMLRDGQRLQQRWDDLARERSEVQMAEEMTGVTASIILGTMFGAETQESMGRLRRAVETLIDFVNVPAQVWLPLWIPSRRNRDYLAARSLVDHIISKLIAERRAMLERTWPDDLLSKLMGVRDDATGEPLPDALVRDEAVTAFFAGHETTARTLTFAWYALATHPRVEQRLHQELDRVLGRDSPSVEQLKRLPYTLNVIKEVLRLYPPAPFYPRDVVEPDRLGPFEVPAGTAVVLSPYYTHRHPQFWDEPEAFNPDRWAPEHASPGRAYHPFAAGQRTCIGNNFALLESHLLLALLAQRFAPRLQPGYQACWEMRGVLGLAGGLPMRITRR